MPNLMDPLDRYYTPAAVADELLARGCTVKPESCADSACGGGSLLAAARRKFDGVLCIGVDKDRAAIQRLRRREPSWLLSVADLLCHANSNKNIRPNILEQQCDLLALNPPFSSNGRRSIRVCFKEAQISCSVAMAHLLRSIEIFSPKLGAVAIVPESLLYSEIDSIARQCVAMHFSIESLFELRSSTFRGGRANARAIRLTPGILRCCNRTEKRREFHNLVVVHVVRGGLPVFEAKAERQGLPYCHSTEVAFLALGGDSNRLPRVRSIDRGHVSGLVVLIPRVGLPRRESTTVVNLVEPIQLSDCVIGLQFGSTQDSVEFVDWLANNWVSFVNLYRGTGARYITMRRLLDWLSRCGGYYFVE